MELFELVAPPGTGHEENDEKCPFCPAETVPTFTTYPGEANDSGILEKLLAKPDRLRELQSNARPQEKDAGRSPKPNPIHSKQPWGDYTCEAHHLISGNQALKGHPFEGWILGDERGGSIKTDSGYSINNALNGLWAPSVPVVHAKGTWGALRPSLKYDIAVEAMRETSIQFHKGPHNIRDHDDQEDRHHTYVRWLKGELTTMDDRMKLWEHSCSLCEASQKKHEKPQPSQRVNQALNRLSQAAKNRITGSASDWEIFISRLALEYHIAVAHPEREVKP